MVADCETGEPQWDNETGEESNCTRLSFPALVRSREARAVQVTVCTDAETGENEWNTSRGNTVINNMHQQNNSNETKIRQTTFHIPKALQHQNFTHCCILGQILFLIFSLLFFPAILIAFCLFAEIFVHCCNHRRQNNNINDTNISSDITHECNSWFHFSPLHIFVSAYCQHCQSDRILKNFGKHQNQKYQNSRIKFKTKNLIAMHS